MTRILLLPMLVLVLVANACGEGDEDREVILVDSTAVPTITALSSQSPQASTAITPIVTATATSAGCALPANGLGRTSSLTMTSGGVTREFLLHLPATEGEAKDGPVVLNFHGLGSNMGEQEIYSGLGPIAEREGFVLVSPNGTGSPRAWQSFGFPGGVDDVQFVRDLLVELKSKYCIDTTATYSTGMSNGAFMSSFLACRAPDLIAAAAPVAGVNMPRQACTGRTPILAFHGMDDALVPYAGGQVFNVLPYAGAEKAVADWAANNGCAEFPGKAVDLGPNVTQITYGQCAGGNDVSLVSVKGGGHTWPGSVIERPNLGAVTKEISASEMAWAFFEAHPRK